MELEVEHLKKILEAVLFTANKPLSVDKILELFPETQPPAPALIKSILQDLMQDYANKGVILKEVASGFRFQASPEHSQLIVRFLEEKPPRYSRALLETLVLIAYRQPITRAEIEEVRGVSVATAIVKTLTERGWVRVVGHRDVPGKPSLFATTREFLDYFNLKSLDELPTLSEIKDLEQLEESMEQLELNFIPPTLIDEEDEVEEECQVI